MDTFRMGAVLALLLALLSSAAAADPTCDSRFSPEPGPEGYRPRKNSERCEGMYQSDVSKPSLSVVSLTKGSFSYPMDGNASLTIVPAKAVPSLVQISVVAIPLKVYYRMDATIAGNGSLTWPLEEVVLKRQLRPQVLGLVGVLPSDERVRRYVPLRAFHDPQSIKNTDPIELVLSSTVDLEALRWRTFPATDGACSKPVGTYKEVARSIDEGAPIRVKVSALDGDLCIDLRGEVKDRDRAIPLTFIVAR